MNKLILREIHAGGWFEQKECCSLKAKRSYAYTNHSVDTHDVSDVKDSDCGDVDKQ